MDDTNRVWLYCLLCDRGWRVSVQQQLQFLVEMGCYPSIHRRGDIWRAHVNTSGNYWAEGKTPHTAIKKAKEMWMKAGCPLDGAATGGGEVKP